MVERIALEKEEEKKMKISPSILSLAIEEIPEKLAEVETEIDFVHIDVMDGKFVSNQTDGQEMFEKARIASQKPLDVHLMVVEPWKEIASYQGAKIITFHFEAVSSQEEFEKTKREIIKQGAKVGISIKPGTPAEKLKAILPEVELVLVMTVEPGYGGQKLIVEALKKISEIRQMGFKGLVEVDGGVTLENVKAVKESGADIIVAGTAIFSSEHPKETIREMKKLT